ncbi:MAG: sugar transferase [Lachnospiraceae bacterium]|nr:sugar transferase [Lachnospiraceae bacterium]
MYQKSPSSIIKHIDFMILDLISFLISFWLAYFIHLDSWMIWTDQTVRSILIIIVLVHICVSIFDSAYKGILRRGYLKEFIAVVKHVALVIAVMLVLLFFMKVSDAMSRMVVAYTAVISLLVIWFERTLWKLFIRNRLAKNPRLLLLVSDQAGAERVLQQFQDQMLDFTVKGIALISEDVCQKNEAVSKTAGTTPERATAAAAETSGQEEAAATAEKTSGRKEAAVTSVTAPGREKAILSGTADPGQEKMGLSAGKDSWQGKTISGVPVVATTDTLIDYLLKTAIDEILFSVPSGIKLPSDLIRQCSLTGITLHLEVTASDELAEARYEEDLAGLTVMTSYLKLITIGQAFFKRMLDIIGGLVGMLFTGLLFIFIAPAIYISDPGPIFFSQERVGKNGRIFKIYKFRSMYQDAEKRKAELMEKNEMKGLMFKLENDPRIIGSGPDGTRHGLGHFIRKTSIDEFPQFWNVLKGEMSLVGTRPPTTEEVSEYNMYHRARLAIKPGITGLWQVSGRSDIDDFEEAVKLDTQYIQNWSLSLDLKILIKTVLVVFTGRGSK